MRVKKIAYIVVGSVLAGLGSHQAYAADAVPAYVKASIETSARPRTEHKADAAMKPADALMFSGVKPGMTVVDILPGTGYFTRLISGVVGDKGAVYMLVPFATGLDDEARRGPAVLDINQNRPMTRIDSAYSVEAQPPYKNNLTVYWEQINNMFSFPKQIDVVFAAGAYHVLKSDEFAKLDMAKANQNIYRAVKNGGYYVVIDNVAKAGSGFSAAKTLNRVEANTVKAEVIAAGFVLDAESAFGANPSDDHGAAATNPQSTDRFALRFKKPATAPNTNKRPPDTKAAVAGYFGNTRRGSVGEKNERRVLYHPDLTYEELGELRETGENSPFQSGYVFYNADGLGCMLHEFPYDQRGFVACSTGRAMPNMKANDTWKGDGDRLYILVPGYQPFND